MYESGMHTPASNCSSNSMVSCGPAPSASGQNDDFEIQLTRRLAEFQATRNDASGGNGVVDRGITARIEKVSQWRQGIAELLDDEAKDSSIEDGPNWKDPSHLQRDNYRPGEWKLKEDEGVNPSQPEDKDFDTRNQENTGTPKRLHWQTRFGGDDDSKQRTEHKQQS